tara:strand:- start:469 stop:936 length:468 start_codon:yes stop_codon:yes gene_type:complete
VKGLLKALAPTLVNVATSGNPVAGVAVKLAAKKLGIGESASIQDIENHIEQNPEKIELVKHAENEIRAMEIELETFKTEVEDRQDAREKNRDANDWTPRLFILLCLLLYGGFIMMITIMPHDQNDETIISLVLGQLSALLGTGGAYYFGSQGGKK